MIAHKYWGTLTAGMSEEAITDLQNSVNQLEHYDKIYSLIEYTSQLHETMTGLEIRMMSNNPSIPMNIYRQSGSSSREKLFPEMESLM
tara:strand:- start:815 stop:1078 length:264 start_codon:yes stop_codon:yes gene_type:complete